jgi:hypothetical protein
MTDACPRVIATNSIYLVGHGDLQNHSNAMIMRGG